MKEYIQLSDELRAAVKAIKKAILQSQYRFKTLLFKRYKFLLPDNGFFGVILLNFLTITKRSRGNKVKIWLRLFNYPAWL